MLRIRDAIQESLHGVLLKYLLKRCAVRFRMVAQGCATAARTVPVARGSRHPWFTGATVSFGANGHTRGSSQLCPRTLCSQSAACLVRRHEVLPLTSPEGDEDERLRALLLEYRLYR